MMGIYTNAPGAGISGNTISGLHATTTSAVVVTVCGIALQGSGMDCSKNKIYDLTNSATAGSPFPYIIGIYNYFNPLGRTISNNMISLSNGALTNGVKIYGILDREGSVAVNYYFNSVAISGTTAAAVNSAAYRRTGNGSSSTKLKGNIFYNNRGGSGDHFALINSNGSATEWPAATSDYNNLYTSNPSTLGAWPDATNRDISSWKTISGGDVNSKNVKTSFLTFIPIFILIYIPMVT